MKALTLWQPWASLVALGVKTIETRSWSTTFRGRLAIHAAAREVDPVAFYVNERERWNAHPPRTGTTTTRALTRHTFGPLTDLWTMQQSLSLPLGAVVATCDLVDVIPMVSQAFAEASDGRHERLLVVEEGQILNVVRPDHSTPVWTAVEDQRPFGAFAPGRFAWMLDNIRPLREPEEAAGRQRLWEWDEMALGANA